MECPASGARPEHLLLRARVADINSNLDNLGAGGVIVDHARRYSRRAAEIFPRPLFSFFVIRITFLVFCIRILMKGELKIQRRFHFGRCYRRSTGTTATFQH